ncbi:uncharacterized protein [Elaeis guineensis]|uniref:uncharacterized protein isoform X2 n=1 Tax=Elaeis guineensis var. tenera TaxID=51953 RepID=UPI003C6CE809
MLVQGMILDDGNIADKSCMIVVTDACLPLVASGETPLLPRILINSDLPTKKETYLRLVSTCLAADMMVGCEVVVLKELDECSGLSFAEMPINWRAREVPCTLKMPMSGLAGK